MKEQLTDDDFYSRYKTIPNHVRDNEKNEWETYGDEIVYIHQVLKEDPSRLWTIIDNNDGWMGIVAGYHHVNRMCYLITEQAWERENEEYTIYDTTELRESWESLPIQAIEEVTGEVLWDMSEEEQEDAYIDNFWIWEELGEQERDEIIAKYKKDGKETESK